MALDIIVFNINRNMFQKMERISSAEVTKDIGIQHTIVWDNIFIIIYYPKGGISVYMY